MIKLIKPVLCIILVLALAYSGFSQVPGPVPVRRGMPLNRMNRPNAGGRRVEVVKETFIGKQLQLTPDEARSFWPLYHQYVEEQTAVRILKRQNNANASPDGTQQIDKELEYEEQLVVIRKRYRDEFQKILPPEKVSILYKSERQFNDEMLNILKERSVRAGN